MKYWLGVILGLALGFCIGKVLEVSAHDSYRGLTVAPENRCSPYHVDDYHYTNKLEDKLAEIVGAPFSPYDNVVYDSWHQMDIEHVVARSEAHDSGLCSADKETRHKFATDMLNISTASAKVNRCGPGGKCGKDVAEWLPSHNQCWFVNKVILVKRKYNLSIDHAELNAMESVLENC